MLRLRGAAVATSRAETHHRAEFQRFGLLLAGDIDGFQETRFGFASLGCSVVRGWGWGLSTTETLTTLTTFEASVPL